MIPLSSAAILEKNRLDSNTNWLILLEIQLVSGEVLRVCRNTDNVEWNGETWVAFPFELDDVQEMTAGEIPQISLRLGNQTKAVQKYLEEGSGGVGATVIIRVIHQRYVPENLTLQDVSGKNITDVNGETIELIYAPAPHAEIEMEFICTGCSATSQWATFTLGTGNPFRKRFPRNRVFKNVCRWKFKSQQCGFVDKPGLTFETCNKTLADCRQRKNSYRFGGFPSAGTSALYVD